MMMKLLSVLCMFFVVSDAFAEKEAIAFKSALPIDSMTIVLSLLLILGLIVGLAWMVQKMRRDKPGTTVGFELVSVFNLGLREKLMVVKAGDRYLLLGVTSDAINLLCDYGKECPESFSAAKKSFRFKDVMAHVLRKTPHG